jgi:hypothetical protein
LAVNHEIFEQENEAVYQVKRYFLAKQKKKPSDDLTKNKTAVKAHKPPN